MIDKNFFNPEVDVQEVDQIGYVDLRRAYETHTIAGNLDVDTSNFNGIEDPESILGKPSNIFEAVTLGHQFAAQAEHTESEG